MTIYIARHGQDDDTVRGGWSNSELTNLSIKQSKLLAEELQKDENKYNIKNVFSSDIKRAKQTTEIISDKLNVPVKFLSEFREINNGDLAGMDNKLASKKYPDLYYRNLEWDECYPNGESPKEFFERISNAWIKFTQSVSEYESNVLLVTHAGVINIIRCIIDNTEYSNKSKYPTIPSAKIALEYLQ